MLATWERQRPWRTAGSDNRLVIEVSTSCIAFHCFKHVFGGSAKRQGFGPPATRSSFDKLRLTSTLAAAGRARTVASFGGPRESSGDEMATVSRFRANTCMENTGDGPGARDGDPAVSE